MWTCNITSIVRDHYEFIYIYIYIDVDTRTFNIDKCKKPILTATVALDVFYAVTSPLAFTPSYGVGLRTGLEAKCLLTNAKVLIFALCNTSHELCVNGQKTNSRHGYKPSLSKEYLLSVRDIIARPFRVGLAQWISGHFWRIQQNLNNNNTTPSQRDLLYTYRQT